MLAKDTRLKRPKLASFSQQLFFPKHTDTQRFISSFPPHGYAFSLSFIAESHVTRQMSNINLYGRTFLKIPRWLVLLPCSPPPDGWLLTIIPVDTKRNFDLMRAAWAHSHVLPFHQSAKQASCNRD